MRNAQVLHLIKLTTDNILHSYIAKRLSRIPDGLAAERAGNLAVENAPLVEVDLHPTDAAKRVHSRFAIVLK